MRERTSSSYPVIIEVREFDEDDKGRNARIVAVEGPETPIGELTMTEADWLRDTINEDPFLVDGYSHNLPLDELPQVDGFYRAEGQVWAEKYETFEYTEYDSGYDVTKPETWVYVGEDETVLDDA